LGVHVWYPGGGGVAWIKGLRGSDWCAYYLLENPQIKSDRKTGVKTTLHLKQR